MATPEEPPAGLARSLAVCALYISVSAGLIHFNKHLMHPDRFPFAMVLTSLHMLTTTLLCGLLFLVRPSLFPSMERTAGRRWQLLRWFAPLGALFAAGLYCSNRAYLYCSVAFLQFMKEANVALVFGLSCLAGLQECSRSKLLVLAWILLGASIAVVGEVHFVWFGFAIQLVSQFGESGKNVLGEWIMRGSDLRLDPLTYTAFMAPACLLVLITGTVLTWQAEVAQRFEQWWRVLLPNAFLAFLLNVSVALVIKECSAVTFVLAGLIKDMAIVAASVLLLGEVVVYQQLLGFGLCLAGIFAWSYMRVQPSSPLLRGMLAVLGEVPKDERAPILGAKPVQV
uniref:Sugar phosphate transporter domain-containing protein n=1 Tax=Alexandrium andersonii TaxID=327968 RepID=A0A7S2AQF0_9DINO|mmetsp:Transcript_16283/g.36722  ORF Transcript_16283/g.36722 Transcript_16283/m.36722 type:complete len:340 (+) Transcript_16283:172-1191(+)